MLPLAISVGDLGGIGIEVTLKGLQLAKVRRPVVLFGDANAITTTAKKIRAHIRLREGLPPAEAESGLYVVSATDLPAREFRPGKPSDHAAASTLEHLTLAVDAVSGGKAAALVTAPIQKERLVRIGFRHPGHTEFLAERTGAKRFAMMLAGDRLKVTLVTIHCALSAVPGKLSTGNVLEKIELTQLALKNWFGVRNPRIAVLGLNPHAGESGLFGNEEEKIIVPAIEQAKRKRIRASGPYPADGFFGQAMDGDMPDAVVAMYHDQGLIPLKLVHFWDGVNVTLGLPIIRTSPDHGTAYDIAGKNKADARSMAQAIRWADRFARQEGK